MKEIIKKTVRKLRKNQTHSEKIFWEQVRGRRVLNKRFLRQYPIEYKLQERDRFFVVDFYCHEFKLVIEIDGSVHNKRVEIDKHRDRILNELGYTVIRFSNTDVENKINDVIKILNEALSYPL